MEILWAVLVLAGLGAIFGFGLAFAAKIFYVKEDTRVTDITAILPNANCGACGFPGCQGYANAIVKGARSISKSCYRPAQFIDQVNIQVPEMTEIMGVAVSRIAASDVVVPFRAISHTIPAAILGIEIHGVVFRIENIRVGCRIAENEVFPDIVSAWINTFASAVILAEGKERIAGSGNGDG